MTPPARIQTAAAAACACLLAFLTPPVAHAANGDISTYAGPGACCTTGDGGPATSAWLQSPIGVAVAANGDMYFADYGGDRVRKITAAGTISTVAGNGTAGFSGDGGPATSAMLNAPGDVAVDTAGNLYISDGGNNRIRKVTPGGTISTFAGIGGYGLSGDGGQASLAQLGTPWGLDFDSSGYLYFADYNHTVRKISPLGIITRVAGTGVAGSTGDGGQAASATLNQPVDVAFDSTGNLYVSEQAGNRIRRITPGGVISTVAGNGTASSTGDGGAATAATLYQPGGLAVDSNDNLYVSEYAAAVIRKISGGTITRVAGTRTAGYFGDGAAAINAQISSPSGIGINSAGNLFIADLGNARIRRVVSVAPPDAPTLSSTTPASPASNNNVKVVGYAAPGSTVSLYTNSTCTSAVAATGSAATFGAAGLSVTVTANTTTTFYATTMVNGLTSACSSSSISYVEDSTGPAAPTVTAPVTPGNSRSPAWSFTGAEPGGTFKCEIKNGTPIYPFATCTSPFTYDLTGKADGTYTFTVKQVDAAGNQGAGQAVDYVLDTSAPIAPSITGGPAALSSDGNPSYSFTAEAGATIECRLERSGVAVYDWATCSSPQAYNLALQTDGAYDLLVRARDAAGNTGPSATRSYTLDRSAPLQPVITSTPASPAQGRSPSWSWTGEAGGSYECRLDLGATQIAGWAACTSGETYSLIGQSDGTYTFSVRQTDGAGNTGSARTSDYTLDTTAPVAPTVTSTPTSPGSGRSPSWSWTGEGGATFQCQLDRGGTIISAYASCTSAKSYSLTGQPDGTYTFSVKATDAAGNTGPAQTSNYALDTTAPVAPSITSSPPSLSNNASPAWSFTGEPLATLECRVERGGTAVYDWATCTSGQAFDLTMQVDGAYTLLVRVRDAAGNVGPTATSGTYTLDRAAPAQPTISSTPGVAGHATNPGWSFSGEAGATFECRLDRGGTQIADWVGCTTSKSYDISGLQDGVYTFSVRQTDGAGNTGSARTSDYTLDTVAPDPPSITSAPSSPGNATAPSWSFSTELGATTECRLDRGATNVSAWAPCSATRSYSLAAQPDGAYTFSVRATDAAGNTGAAQTSSYTLDRAAPTAPSVTPPATPGNDAAPSWSFFSEAGATFECKLARGATIVSDWASCTSAKSYSLGGQPDGTYTFSVRATDTAGNTGVAQTSDYVFDTTPPAVAGIGTSPPSPGNDTAPHWSFSGGAGGNGFECKLDRGATPVSGWSACTSPVSFDLSSEPDGTYTLSVRARDAAGNRSAAVTSDFTLDTSVPVTPAIDSAPGATGSGRNITWGFSGAGTETFECRLIRGATTISDWASCTSPRAYSLTGEPDGTYTFAVRGVAPGGTRGASESDNYILDTSAPAAPAITTPPPVTGSAANPTWAFTAEEGALVECRIDRDGTEVVAWATCSSPYTADLSGKPDGTYTLRLRATDAAGNTGPEQTSTYSFDTTAPTAPAVSAPASSTANNAQPGFPFVTQAGYTYECRLGGAPAPDGNWQACTSPRLYDLSGRPDGVYTFQVRATDAAGNVGAPGSVTYELDRAPASVQLGATPSAVSNERWPSWGFSAEAGATFECSLAANGGGIFDWSLCTSPQMYDLSTRGDGSYVFSVRARDRAGNLGSPISSAYTLDTAAPAKPAIKATPATPSRDRSPTWTFTAEAGAAIECRLELKRNPVYDWAACTSPKTYSLRDADDGIYRLLVRARDVAGNTGPNATDDYELDSTDPAPPTIDAAPQNNGTDVSPTWKFSSENDAQFECSLDRGSDSIEKRAPCASPQTYKVDGLPAGTYTFSVWATDPAGNTSRVRQDQFVIAASTSSASGAPGTSPSSNPPGSSGTPTTAPGTPGTSTPSTPNDSKAAGKNSKQAAGKSAHGAPGTRPGQPGATAGRPGATGSGGDGSSASSDNGSGKPQKKRHGAAAAAHAVAAALGKAATVVTKNADKSVFPFSLVLIVFLFLGIQNRIDRGDPKLALAPLTADPDLEFSPPPTKT